MTSFVVDASVGMKWYVTEVHSDAASRLWDGGHELHVPSLFYIEISNALWMKVRRGELSQSEATAIFAKVAALPLVRYPDATLAPTALTLAFQTQRSVYDCTYLELALQLGVQLATADERFHNALANTSYAASICWIANVP
jgi:predicted nucleic acid-binding protein